MDMHFQCRLRRDNNETVGWIEARGAKVGAAVELLPGDSEFWKVVEVYKPGIEGAVLREKQARDRNALPSIIGRG